jgi:hypothetical protein
MRLIGLISDLPPNTQQKVTDAKKRYNLLLREAIRSETRLSLNTGVEFDTPDNQGSVKIPVQIIAAYPEYLERFKIPEEFRHAALLSQIRPSLYELKESASLVGNFISDYQDDPIIFKYCGGAIFYASQDAEELLEIAKQYDLAKEILQVNHHILGCYSFKSYESRGYRAKQHCALLGRDWPGGTGVGRRY